MENIIYKNYLRKFLHHDNAQHQSYKIRSNHLYTTERGTTVQLFLFRCYFSDRLKVLSLYDYKLIVAEQNNQISGPMYLYCIASLQHM